MARTLLLLQLSLLAASFLLDGVQGGETCYEVTAGGGINEFYCVSGCCGTATNAECCISTVIVVSVIVAGFVLMVVAAVVGGCLYNYYQNKKRDEVRMINNQRLQGVVFSSVPDPGAYNPAHPPMMTQHGPAPNGAPPPAYAGSAADPAQFSYMPYPGQTPRAPKHEAPPDQPAAAWGGNAKAKVSRRQSTRARRPDNDQQAAAPAEPEHAPAPATPVNTSTLPASVRARLGELPPLPPVTQPAPHAPAHAPAARAPRGTGMDVSDME